MYVKSIIMQWLIYLFFKYQQTRSDLTTLPSEHHIRGGASLSEMKGRAVGTGDFGASKYADSEYDIHFLGYPPQKKPARGLKISRSYGKPKNQNV